jgi:hypothetical protein
LQAECIKSYITTTGPMKRELLHHTLAAAAAIVLQAECIKSYLTTTGPIMSELLAIVALRNQQQLVGRCVDIIRDNLAAAVEFFSR